MVWFLSKADEDHCVRHLNMPGHWSSNFPCRGCKATKDDDEHGWKNLDPTAPWKATVFYNYADWRDHCRVLSKTPHLLFQTREEGGLGLHPFAQAKDRMHTLDMGPTLYVNGNVLWHLCYTDIIRPNDPDGVRLEI